MKHFLYATFIFPLFVASLQAAEEPAVIALKGTISRGTSAVFSPDSKKIVMVRKNRTVQIRNTESGKILQTLPPPKKPENWNEYLFGNLKKTWNHYFTYTPETRMAHFSPDGKKVIVGNDDGIIKVYDAESGEELYELPKQTVWSWFAVFSPDSTKIVATGTNGTAQIFDAETGKELLKLEGHTQGINFADFSPDGKKIVSGSFDKTVRIWDAETGKELQKLEGHTRVIDFVAFSPDGKKVLSALDNQLSGGNKVWDVESGKELYTMEKHRDVGGYGTAFFSPDSKKIITRGLRPQVIQILDAESGKNVQELEWQDGAFFAAFSPDGTKIVLGYFAVWIFDAGSGKLLQKVGESRNTVTFGVFSPDGKKIATAGENTVSIWTLGTLSSAATGN